MPRVPEVCTRVFCPHFSKLGSSIARTLSAAKFHLSSVCSVGFPAISRCAGGPLPSQSASGDTSNMGIAQTGNSVNLFQGNGSSIKPPNPFQHETLWITIVASLLSILVSILKIAELITGSSP